MQRDLNDIIPPSRRRALAAEEQSAGLPAHVQATSVPPAPMSDMHTERPQAPAPRTLEEAVVPKVHVYEPAVIAPKKRFPIGTALVALIVVAGCGAVLYSFSGAKVVITPVTAEATVTADLDAMASAGDLTFQTITVDKVATVDVASEGTITSNDAAQGSITITNQQTTSQALIKNTRFATPTGLVFRIHDSVSIPATGSLQVPVYADEPGDKYNIAPTTFTIPGLKGNKAFDLVTAKSIAPMAGGFSGTRPSVAQGSKDKQYASMQAQLTTELQKQLATKVPVGFVLIPGASFPSYTPQPDAASGKDKVTLAEKGTITAVVFPSEGLARAVAFKAIGTYDGSPLTFASVDKLLIKPVETTLAPDATDFKFNISGNSTLVWKVDPQKIAGAVSGKSRDSAEVALKSFLEVDKATLVLRPFWSSTFPSDPKKIQVVVNAPGSSK